MLGNIKIGFIGGGNMSYAMVRGLLSSGKSEPNLIYVSDKNGERHEKMSACGVFTSDDNSFVEKNSDIIIFAVKPNVFDAVMSDITGYADKIYISIAASITLDYLAKKLGNDKKIVRTMPNTPALVNSGMTVICPNKNLEIPDIELAEEIFKSMGEVLRLDEKYINAAMALQGSAPAYVYMMIDAMADGGVKHGLSRDIACRLAAKTVEGSAKMVLQSGEHPAKLKNDVCSPGGTTIEAVHVLEEEGFPVALHKAIDACVKKGGIISEK